MAVALLVPANGAVAYGTLVAYFHSATFTQRQPTQDVTPFGDNVCSVNIGNGTPTFDISIEAFPEQGTADTPPGLDTASPAGLSTTLTFDTGCTEALDVVQQSFALTIARMQAAEAAQIRGVNGGDVVETWATGT